MQGELAIDIQRIANGGDMVNPLGKSNHDKDIFIDLNMYGTDGNSLHICGHNDWVG